MEAGWAKKLHAKVHMRPASCQFDTSGLYIKKCTTNADPL